MLSLQWNGFLTLAELADTLLHHKRVGSIQSQVQSITEEDNERNVINHSERWKMYEPAKHCKHVES